MEPNFRHFIEKHTLFQGLETAVLDGLRRDTSLLQLRKGDGVMGAGEQGSFIFIVMSGWVKIFRETLGGVEVVIDVLGEGKIFGETALTRDGAYTYSAEAVDDSFIVALDINRMRELIEKNGVFSRNWLERFATEIERKNHELEHLAVQSTSERIGCFLLRLVTSQQEGQAEFELPYDKTLIALKLGMQPETFSRALVKLRDATGIHINGSQVNIPAIEKLSHYSCHACSSEFPCPDRLGNKK